MAMTMGDEVRRSACLPCADVSYDVEVATHDRPDAIDAPDGVTVDGPFSAEPDDLAERARRGGARAALADDGVGRQRDAARKRRPPAGEAARGRGLRPAGGHGLLPAGQAEAGPGGEAGEDEHRAARVVRPAERWPAAPAALVARSPAAVRRRCRRATATSSRCSSATTPPDAFSAFARDHRRSGSPRGRRSAATRSPPARHLGLDFDWRVLDADPRWREAVAGLFAAAAAALGAFYAECWVEPGWNVSRNNRLSIAAGRKTRASALRATGGRVCPPSPRG